MKNAVKGLKTYEDLYNLIFNIRGNEASFKELLNASTKTKDIQLYCLIMFLQLKWGFPESWEYYCDITNGKFTEFHFYKHPYEFFYLESSVRELKIKSNQRCVWAVLVSNEEVRVVSYISYPTKNINLRDLKAADFKFLSGYPKDYTETTALCITNQAAFDVTFGALKRSKIKTTIQDMDKVFAQTMIDTFMQYSERMVPWEQMRKSYRSGNTIIYRPHQDYTINATIEKLQSTEHPLNILWGHIARSGKSYMMYGLINAMLACDPPITNHNYLIITTAPNETIPQYQQLFASMQTLGVNLIFTKHEIKQFSEGNANTDMNIIVASKQMLTHTSNKNMRLPDLGLIMIDEAHFGGTTARTKHWLSDYDDVHKIFVTATYEKVRSHFDLDMIVKWDLQDIQMCKREDGQSLCQKHPEIYDSLRNAGDPFSGYKKFPDLTMVGLDPAIIRADPKTLFDLSKPAKVAFENHDDVRSVFGHIFKDVIPALDAHNKKIGQRSILNKKDPSVILCFAPWSDISTISVRLEEIVANIYPSVFIGKCNTTDSTTPFKETLNKAIEDAKKSKKEAVFAIAGTQGHLGITIPKCDVVIMANDIHAADFNFQAMFRCMTEANAKQFGYVIDLNFHRCTNLLSTYSSYVYDDDDCSKYQLISRIVREGIIRLVPSSQIDLLDYEPETMKDGMMDYIAMFLEEKTDQIDDDDVEM